MLAHFCYAQTITGEFFEQWFKKSLLNTVKKGCTIIMDNVSFHRKKKLEEIATEGQVKLLFLPPYSPDFNPIEKCWTNLKRALVGLSPDFSDVASAIYFYYKYDTC
jgi:transposase